MQKTILIVDDERDITSMLRDYFTYNSYRVLTAENGRDAITLAAGQPDLILLDVGMPDLDGLTVCRRIRDVVGCPILFLTARVEDSDKIKGFAAGGDDYIVKPFSIEELGARVAAHLRRESRRRTAGRVHFGDDLTIDYAGRELWFRGRRIALAKKEFDIVELLSQHAGQIFDRERIYELIWGYDSDGDSMVVAEHIRRVRHKFTAAGGDAPIQTVWGVGYKWSKS